MIHQPSFKEPEGLAAADVAKAKGRWEYEITLAPYLS